MRVDPQPEHRSPAKLVLIVDDDAGVRHALAERLRGVGFKVCVASNADEAVTLLNSSLPIDAVVTDVNMPGKFDGIHLIEAIHQIGLRVIMAVVSGSDVSHRLRDGVKFFRKPYSGTSLIEFLKGALETR